MHKKTSCYLVLRYIQKKGRQDNKMVIMSDMAKISLDMPGSRADRELTAELAVNRADPKMTLRLHSPWKKFDLAGGCRWLWEILVRDVLV